MRPSLELGLIRAQNPRQYFDVNFDAFFRRIPVKPHVRGKPARSLAGASSRSFALAIETDGALSSQFCEPQPTATHRMDWIKPTLSRSRRFALTKSSVTSHAPRRIDIFDAWTTKNDFPFPLAAHNFPGPCKPDKHEPELEPKCMFVGASNERA